MAEAPNIAANKVQQSIFPNFLRCICKLSFFPAETGVSIRT
jgi:hypothetical protein